MESRPIDVEAGQRDSRVLVFSQRRQHSPIWHATQTEFEDVLDRIDDVAVLSPPGQPLTDLQAFRRKAVNGARQRLGLARRTAPWRIPLMQPTTVNSSHDLFFAVFHHSHELLNLHNLRGWREKCSKAACFLIETWTPDLRTDTDYLRLLQDFDVVYVLNPALKPGLLQQGVPDVRYLPSATDALLFSPLPHLPQRVVDFYSYGRSSPVTHAALVELVQSRGLTYLYDTTAGGRVSDPTHRHLLANMMKRARYSLAYTINDSPERRRRTGGDEVISTRYFEAAAGGAVMLGSRPIATEFDMLFDWPDVVIPVPYECEDIGDVLHDLDAQGDRLASVRANNVRNSLLRHDWSHRWQVVLQDFDLTAGEALRHRQLVLAQQAERITPGALSAVIDATQGPAAR